MFCTFNCKIYFQKSSYCQFTTLSGKLRSQESPPELINFQLCRKTFYKNKQNCLKVSFSNKYYYTPMIGDCCYYMIIILLQGDHYSHEERK